VDFFNIRLTRDEFHDGKSVCQHEQGAGEVRRQQHVLPLPYLLRIYVLVRVNTIFPVCLFVS
ncbi:MAG: hypothetical protein RX317_07235, partial [bacterium]|nr:hypothetical protein [bacterium]